MPIYHITETKPVVKRWFFSVVAENEEEALLSVAEGKVDPVSEDYDEDPFEGSEYSVDSQEDEI